ncbi:F0F1 ATP synthase subunit gamma [Ancylobacter mangrovi]|uniref:F0F1 ATP synthase subunit gamma n=1 Tax=Ancylobacter mangrovi TaxID=2972472 RepID=UPI0021621BB8|nr:FoF1 ATP synthase subunit gamma [Ancylobacter mangrovi]MCS0503466.1 F0F1 ATP synthase subunit gamma [Ancylobacter mangrovi]
MSERLSDVVVRIQSVQQLSAVIAAMRGISAARSREARGQLDGVRAYAETIAVAIGDALEHLPSGPPIAAAPAEDRHAIVALCAEQGFAGTFNERVLDAVEERMKRTPGTTRLLLVGDRGLMAAGERRFDVSWSAAMIAHVGQATSLANRIVEELYRALDQDEVRSVSIVHAFPGASATVDVREQVLIPFDYARFPIDARSQRPLVTLPPDILLARLAEEYIFAELCEAVIQSFAAENEARMRAMIAAKSNVEHTLDDLVARSRRLRQEEITNEILELSSTETDAN